MADNKLTKGNGVWSQFSTLTAEEQGKSGIILYKKLLTFSVN
jgi:hypothetical protein